MKKICENSNTAKISTYYVTIQMYINYMQTYCKQCKLWLEAFQLDNSFFQEFRWSNLEKFQLKLSAFVTKEFRMQQVRQISVLINFADIDFDTIMSSHLHSE